MINGGRDDVTEKECKDWQILVIEINIYPV